MQTRNLILLTIVLASCGQPVKSVQQQVFDDYLLIHFQSWSEAMASNYVPDFDYESGDTIRSTSQLNMLIIPNDTTTQIVLADEKHVETRLWNPHTV